MVFALLRTVMPHSLEKLPTLVNESTKGCPGQTGMVKFCSAPAVNVYVFVLVPVTKVTKWYGGKLTVVDQPSEN